MDKTEYERLMWYAERMMVPPERAATGTLGWAAEDRTQAALSQPNGGITPPKE